MSHFTTITVHKIGQDPEEILKPFDENKEVPRYVRYTRAEIIKRGREDIERAKKRYEEWKKNPEEYERDSNEAHINFLKNEFPERIKWTDDQIYKDEIEFERPEDLSPTGGVYSTYNPDAKWDWYSMGGRWTGYFKLKKGAKGVVGEEGYVDQARFEDIDWNGMLEDKRKKAEENWLEFQELLKKDVRDAEFRFDTPKDITKEKFVEGYTTLAPFAFIDKNGRWCEKGNMGWWGIVTNEDKDSYEKQFAAFLKTLEPDDILTLWDLHI